MRKDDQDNLGKRVFIELGTHLQLEMKELKLSLKSELVGMEVGEYLITRLNNSEDVQAKLYEGCEVVAKYLHQHAVFGFQSKIISLISKPENIVFIEYPDKIESVNIRTSHRIDCFLPILVEIGFNTVDGVMLNINNEGCCLSIKGLKIMDEQTLEKIVIHVHDKVTKKDFSLLGNIRSLRESNGEMNLGIEFDEMDSNTQTLILELFPTLDIPEIMAQ